MGKKLKKVKEVKFGPVETVLWSGGADSTLLLYDRCKLAAADKEGFRKVRALTIIHPRILNSGFAEEYRKGIWKRFMKFGFSVEHHVL